MAIALRKIEKAHLFESREKLSEAIGKDKTYVGDLINTLKMDYRIVENLAEYKTTDDVRLLRAIRKAFPATKQIEEQADTENERWISDQQWDFYSKTIIQGQLSRDEVIDEIKTLVGARAKDIKIITKKRKMLITIPFILNQDVIDQIQAIIDKETRKTNPNQLSC
jgi:hypothetical protein